MTELTEEDPIVGYMLEPVRDSAFRGMQVATPSRCALLRGVPIRGCGGRDDIFSVYAVNLMLNDKTIRELCLMRFRELGHESLAGDPWKPDY